MTSFGGPVAHLSYFHTEFVERRRWLSEHAFADLVALCQFLPGPASSKVGFALGWMRAGVWGAVAAWVAFTLPSAIIMVLLAMGAARFNGPLYHGILQGLKITAVAIVAHAVWGMARKLCPDWQRAAIAVAVLAVVQFIDGPWGQVAAIGLGALAGMALCRRSIGTLPPEPPLSLSPRVGHLAGITAVALLIGLPLVASASPLLAVMDAFYRAGALVFGGGHVVLPLLEAEVVQSGRVSAGEFLAGYGAAQAIPGPLFTFAAYLGAIMQPGGGLLQAVVALVMIFLPGMLLLIAALPHWSRFRHRQGTQSLLRGANAAVVGILAAAFYKPVWSSTITGPLPFALALAGFLLLTFWRIPAWAVVVMLATCGAVAL